MSDQLLSFNVMTAVQASYVAAGLSAILKHKEIELFWGA